MACQSPGLPPNYFRDERDRINHRLDLIRHHQCVGKIKYKDPDTAIREVFRITKGDKGDEWLDVDNLNAYYCVFCNNYHLGNIVKNDGHRDEVTIENLLYYDFTSPEIPFDISRRAKYIKSKVVSIETDQ